MKQRPLTFINTSGQPLDPYAGNAKRKAGPAKTHRVDDEAKATISRGFIVTGTSATAFRAAEQHAKVTGEFFDPAEYFRHAKRTKINTRPYNLHEAAVQCLEMASRAGWVDLRIDELLAAEE